MALQLQDSSGQGQLAFALRGILQRHFPLRFHAHRADGYLPDKQRIGFDTRPATPTSQRLVCRPAFAGCRHGQAGNGCAGKDGLTHRRLDQAHLVHARIELGGIGDRRQLDLLLRITGIRPAK